MVYSWTIHQETVNQFFKVRFRWSFSSHPDSKMSRFVVFIKFCGWQFQWNGNWQTDNTQKHKISRDTPCQVFVSEKNGSGQIFLSWYSAPYFKLLLEMKTYKSDPVEAMNTNSFWLRKWFENIKEADLLIGQRFLIEQIFLSAWTNCKNRNWNHYCGWFVRLILSFYKLATSQYCMYMFNFLKLFTIK